MAEKKSIFDLADKFGYNSPWDNWISEKKDTTEGPLITDLYAYRIYDNIQYSILSNVLNKKNFLLVKVVVKIDGFAGKVEVEFNGKKQTALFNMKSSQYETTVYIDIPILFTYKIYTFNATVFDYQSNKSDKKSISYKIPAEGDLVVNNEMGDYSIKCELLPPNSKQISSSSVYPLDIGNQPVRDPNASGEEKITDIFKIVNFLNSPVEKKYQKKIDAYGKLSTFCNVYAYDFTHLNKAYIPRVWWNDDSIFSRNPTNSTTKSKYVERLRNGEKITAIYAVNANEVTANQLFFWLEKYGEEFGWNRITGANEFDENELILKQANEGKICIVTAKVKDLSFSGHIAIVLPEHKNYKVERDKNNRVTKLLTSQAGLLNWKVQTDDFWIIYKSTYDHAFYWHY